MKVMKVYGTYWGQRKLAWVGFENRINMYFKKQGKYLARIEIHIGPNKDMSIRSDGWGLLYQIGA